MREGATAMARSEEGNATILLEAGRVDLQVQPRAPGRSFAVKAGPFSFVVVGTAFSVSRQPEQVTLDVSEGRVAVVREGQQLASITAGGSWTGQTQEQTQEQTQDLTPPAPPQQRRPRAIAARQASPGHGPDSDVAAYEAARLWMGAAGDLERARIGFESYRTRFPHGALRVEAALSLVEILPRLGRHREALAETDRLLADPEAQPRYPEIHLVRGNIYRLALGDRNAAAAEYRAAAAGSGATADEAAYLHTVCLEELGRRLEARNALDLYLARPDARRTNEALRRRNALSR
jgi:ferric-dicitrate binding protein FerR (iron transport regulator)